MSLMPLYEYKCEEDGEVLTLLRSMAEADDPVEDPRGDGRQFTRVHSVFQVDSVPGASAGPGNPPPASGGCCCGPCGCS
ncbi:MAG: FmdB family transcriptional regulator [Phycisphaerae bacterium]|nr:FmdB family transcriptional regulator [Phycisphaerae bacterium]